MSLDNLPEHLRERLSPTTQYRDVDLTDDQYEIAEYAHQFSVKDAIDHFQVSSSSVRRYLSTAGLTPGKRQINKRTESRENQRKRYAEYAQIHGINSAATYFNVNRKTISRAIKAVESAKQQASPADRISQLEEQIAALTERIVALEER